MNLPDGYIFSTGHHPWDSNLPIDYTILESSLAMTNVTAVGETGLDTLRGASIDIQTHIFEKHIELSEYYHKPMIIHCVKAYQRLIEIKSACKPSQPWIIHGFRQNPQVARMLIDKGMYISLGNKFNSNTARYIPSEYLLIETDQSELSITDIASAIASAKRTDTSVILETSKTNIKKIFAK